MTITQQIITQLSGTAAGIRSQLAETVTVPSGRGRLTHAWVAENISLAVADGVYAAIASVSVPTAQRYNVGTGIDTTVELWKQQAAAVAASSEALAPHLVTLRDFESIQVTRWVSLGGTGEIPSVETIQSILDAESTRAWWAAKSAVVEEGLHGLTITTKAQVRDVIGGD